MGRDVTLESFTAEFKDHKLHVFKDDGIYRHIYLAMPGTGCQSFHIVTWPGCLTYTGDMGTYVFNRIDDMFQFFRSPKDQPIRTNPGYWGQKLEAVDRHGGYKNWDLDAFQENVTEHIRMWKDLGNDDPIPEDIEESIWSIRNAEDEYEAVTAIRNHSDDAVNFDDFWDGNSCEVVSGRFQWACWAIPHAIRMYDEFQSTTEGAK